MTSATLPQDEHFMQVALRLSARHLGLTSPNPSVGCVLVKEGRIIGQGVTARGGRPHAETLALTMAGEAAKGATAYVTLEPCSHHGVTGPCAEALITAGIARAVIAVTDPDSRVSRKGIARLREAGISVILGVGEKEAKHLHAGFFMVRTGNRPLVTVKLATSLDGKIALANGKSQWITGIEARNYGHSLRATHDAIMVGINTAIADDPLLTCRLPGLEDRSPIRIVCDSKLRLMLNSRLVQTAGEVPSWIVTAANHTEKITALKAQGVEIVHSPRAQDGKLDMKSALYSLTERGITRLLIEGGGRLVAALLQQGLVDNIVWMRAPKIIGNDGIPAVARLELKEILQAEQFTRDSYFACGEDTIELFSRA